MEINQYSDLPHMYLETVELIRLSCLAKKRNSGAYWWETLHRFQTMLLQPR